jgi:uncharacterized damage-inducible protein DinB
MDAKQFFQNLFEYDYWGNREALASLGTVGSAAERPRKFLCHIIGAQRLWLARFDNPSPTGVEPWPALSLEECRAAVEELHLSWSGRLDQFAPESFAQDLLYRNTKGVEFRTPLKDVLTHLVMHSAYHRGQVAAAVREAGGKPAATDYVVYARQR